MDANWDYWQGNWKNPDTLHEDCVLWKFFQEVQRWKKPVAWENIENIAKITVLTYNLPSVWKSFEIT